MSRARLTQTPVDLVTDGGAILLSIVKGEQIEFPVTLNFLSDTTEKPSNNYIYEAVVVEAKNVSGQSSAPIELMPSGVNTTLTVRKPIYQGTWNAPEAYNKEDVILYGDKYYKLSSGTARVSSIAPSSDPMWVETVLNIIYIQIPSTLASTWSIQPIVGKPVYGFFELRVSEPADPIYTRTWKPVRGMVEVLFSPTDVVADV